MNESISWNMEELQSAYNKLGDCITQLREIISSNEKSNNELKENWVTAKSQVYYNEADRVKNDALRMIAEYENAREQLYRKIQILKSLDEE